ncbi:MAG TPA: hypothetical protein VLI04_18240 [Nocardioidaceae bacterium]|nr:hypothetical protein [Nocardioidaceae bacterium]
MAEETPTPLAEPVTEKNWTLRIVLILVALVFLGVAYLFGTTVVPRWWAHRVGNRVDGSLTAGTFYGLFIGFVFTLAPLLVARQVFRRRMSNKLRVSVLVLALLAAAPNLITLSIVLGTSNAAHAGERILDVEGPGFRAGSAWGAVLAVMVAIGLFAWTWKWRRDRRQLKALRSEKKAAGAAQKDSETAGD